MFGGPPIELRILISGSRSHSASESSLDSLESLAELLLWLFWECDGVEFGLESEGRGGGGGGGEGLSGIGAARIDPAIEPFKRYDKITATVSRRMNKYKK